MSRKRKSAQDRFQDRAQNRQQQQAERDKRIQDVLDGWQGPDGHLNTQINRTIQAVNQSNQAAVNRMQTLAQAMSGLQAHMGRSLNIPPRHRLADQAEDVIESLISSKPYDSSVSNIDINTMAEALEAAGLFKEPDVPTIRAGQAPTLLAKKRPTCPRHGGQMKFRPSEMVWHCTADECGVTAYQVKDGVEADPTKPQVVAGVVDLIVAKTEDGERTYLRVKSTGIFVDLTPQLATVDHTRSKTNQSVHDQLQVVLNANLTYVDYTS